MSHRHSPRVQILNWSIFVACLFGLVLAMAAGCSKAPPALLPNKDKALRKSAGAFQREAAQRHPYPADAPRSENGGGAAARAQVGYSSNQLEVVNLSPEPWTDVDVWVNGTHVVHVPAMKPFDLKVLNFRMLYDAAGRPFPENNARTPVKKVEVLLAGQLHEVPVALAD
jgi:hypothetical protein